MRDKAPLWWRIRFLWHWQLFWKYRMSPAMGWALANTFDRSQWEDESPKDALHTELSYWD